MTTVSRAVPPLPAQRFQFEQLKLGPALVSRLYLGGDASEFSLGTSPANLAVVLQVAGRSRVSHSELACCLRAGQWTVFERGVQDMVFLRPLESAAQLLILQLPRDCLAADTPFPLHHHQELRPYANRALSRTLRVFSRAPQRLDAALSDRVVPLFCRVLEHALREQCYADLRAGRAAFTVYAKRLDRACQYIKRRMDHPGLALNDIAKDAACTGRYLQKMFAPGGQTVREFILHLRLEAVHCALLSPQLWNRPVTEIALAHGFNNASHFTRKYHRHFGITPSVLRLMHQRVRLRLSAHLPARAVAKNHRLARL